MIEPSSPMTLKTLCDRITELSGNRLECDITHDGDNSVIQTIAPLEGATDGTVAFLANPKYREVAKACQATALVVTKDDKEAMWGEENPNRILVICRNPYAWFALALQILYPEKKPASGIHATAIIEPGAVVDPTCTIESNVVIRAGAKVGANTRIGANTVIAEGVSIGKDCHLYPNVNIYYGCRIGDRCTIHSGSVIGADGFGFAPLDDVFVKIPQVGAVEIGDDVEIGANTCIDRGALQSTRIGNGTKIDDLVMIGHNCQIGRNSVISGRSGLAGSTIIGDNCQIGGGAGFAGHLSIPSGSIIGGGAGVPGSIEKPGYYAGYMPAMPHKEFFNILSVMKKLPEMRRQIKRLEAQINDKK
ncbi:MAG: UDP-3-O-(3-hydroxymyristoyl)glucosamine N-acyltransferase [Burkholderiaceae bacterium]|nr:UDP-3-O-(3-hydroxymyristoyl)glucosamine N-acyltransferase [Burkholderiaceae bacterium]